MTTLSPGARGPFSFDVPRLLPASPERVFKAWTNETEAAAWLANGGRVILQPHVDGLFFIDMVYMEHTYPHYGRYWPWSRTGASSSPGCRRERMGRSRSSS